MFLFMWAFLVGKTGTAKILIVGASRLILSILVLYSSTRLRISESFLIEPLRKSFVPQTKTTLEYPMQLSGQISPIFAARCLLPGYVSPTDPIPEPNLMSLVLESPWIITLLLFFWETQRKVRENLSSAASTGSMPCLYQPCDDLVIVYTELWPGASVLVGSVALWIALNWSDLMLPRESVMMLESGWITASSSEWKGRKLSWWVVSEDG